MVTGVYDIIAKVEAKTFDDLVDIINRCIRRITQIQSTLSMIIVESKKPGQEQQYGAIVV